MSGTSSCVRAPFSVLERAAIEELDETPAELSRLERLLIAAIVEIGRLESGRPAASPELHDFQGLTRRENDVLRLIVDGRTSRAAAMELGISARTVEVHRLRVLRKLGLRSSTELIRVMTDGSPMTAPARVG